MPKRNQNEWQILIYLPLVDETDPRRFASRPRLRLRSLSLSDVGESDRIRLALFDGNLKQKNR